MSEAEVIKDAVSRNELHTYGHRHARTKSHTEVDAGREKAPSVCSSPIMSPGARVRKLLQDIGIPKDDLSSDEDDGDSSTTPLRRGKNENEDYASDPKGQSVSKTEYDLLRAKMMQQKTFLSETRRLQYQEDEVCYQDDDARKKPEVMTRAFTLMNDDEDENDGDGDDEHSCVNDSHKNSDDVKIHRTSVSANPSDAKPLESSPIQTENHQLGGLFIISEDEDGDGDSSAEKGDNDRSSSPHSRLMALLDGKDDDEEQEEEISDLTSQSPSKKRPEREAGKQAMESIRLEINQQQLSYFASSKPTDKKSRLRLFEKFGVTEKQPKQPEIKVTNRGNSLSPISSDNDNEPSSTPPTSPIVLNIDIPKSKEDNAKRRKEIILKGHRTGSTIDLDSDSDSDKQTALPMRATQTPVMSKSAKSRILKKNVGTHNHHHHGQPEKVSLKQLRIILLEKTRDQMLHGKRERERMLKDKGIIMMTAEEKAKEQVSIAEMLEAERTRAAELSKLERKDDRDDDILDDNDDDDGSYNGEVDDDRHIEMSGSESDDENENDGKESSEEEDSHINLEGEKQDSLYEPLGTVPNRERGSEQAYEQKDKLDIEEEDEEQLISKRTARSKRLVIADDDDDDEDANGIPNVTESNTQVDDTSFNAPVSRTNDPSMGKANGIGGALSQFFADSMEDSDGTPADSQAILDKMRQKGQADGTPVTFARKGSPTILTPSSNSPSVSSLYRAQQRNAQLLEEVDQQATQISEFSDPVTSFSQHIPSIKEGVTLFDSIDDDTQLITDVVTLSDNSIHESTMPIIEQDKKGGSLSTEKFNKKSQYLDHHKGKLAPDKNAKNFFDAEAEESEDEYQGIGGISDDDEEENDDQAKDLEGLVDDTNMENISRAELEALHVENEREQDGKLVNQIFHDVMTGGLRKRRRQGADGAGIIDLSESDDDDEHAQRMQRKRRALEKRKAKLLEEDEISKIAANPKAKAFLKELEEEMTEFKVKSVYSCSIDDEVQVMETQDCDSPEQDGTLSDPSRSSTNRSLKRKSTGKRDVIQETREQLSFLHQEPRVIDLDYNDEAMESVKENINLMDDTQVIPDISKGASVIELTDDDDDDESEGDEVSILKPRSHDNVPKLPNRAFSKLQSIDPTTISSTRSYQNNAVEEAEKGTVPRKNLLKSFNMSSSPTRGSSAPRFSSSSKSFSVVRSAVETTGNKNEQEGFVTTNEKKKIISSFSKGSARTLNMRSFQNRVRSAVTYNTRKRKEPAHKQQHDKATKAKSHELAAKLTSQSIVTRMAHGSFS